MLSGLCHDVIQVSAEETTFFTVGIFHKNTFYFLLSFENKSSKRKHNFVKTLKIKQKMFETQSEHSNVSFYLYHI